MEVNHKKTKVVVFRKDRKTFKSERFLYTNRSVETVTYDRYLALISPQQMHGPKHYQPWPHRPRKLSVLSLYGGWDIQNYMYLLKYFTAELSLFYAMIQRLGVIHIKIK